MGKIRSPGAGKLLPLAEKVLDSVTGLWRPGAVGTWLDLLWVRDGCAGFGRNGFDGEFVLNLGSSSRFLESARQALAAVYTAGGELEAAGQAASAGGRLLESYLIDLIGLIVLDKTGLLVREAVEGRAREKGWGAGPFLSPGSVLGWELEDQAILCSTLQLGEIGVTMGPEGILMPFKSLSCLLPIGPGYDRCTVGSTCEVCSRNQDCPMRPPS
jgi:hypothetical protein